MKIIEFTYDARDIADAVAIGIAEGTWIDLVDDAALKILKFHIE